MNITAFRNENSRCAQDKKPFFYMKDSLFHCTKKAFLDITTSGTACYGCTRRIGVFTPQMIYKKF